MNNKFTLVIFALLISLSAFAGGQKRKVLVIGIDGTRADCLQIANTPNIDSLVATGFYTFNSWHVDITVSGPSWSSIMTGVYHQKHGVTGNSYSNSHYDSYPYFPKHAKEYFPNLQCVQYTEWAPMSDYVYNDGWNLKLKGPDGNEIATGTAAINILADPDLDCAFIYFDKNDLTGHSSGFSPDNPAYINSIQAVDVQVGRIVTALKARPTYAQEDWLILLTTDHGGIGTGHGGNSLQERTIWWIANSDRGISHEVPVAVDPGTHNPLIPQITLINDSLQKLSPVQADIATTALHHLIWESGVLPDTVAGWNLDGKSWLCDYGLCSDKAVSGVNEVHDNLHFGFYANNWANLITLWIEKASDYNTIHIFDLNGKQVYEEKFVSNGVKYTFTAPQLAQGNYVLMLEQDGKYSAQKFTW